MDPYWQKQDFLRRNPQFETPVDLTTGVDQVSVPEILSPEISLSGQTPSTYETGQASNRPLANGVFDIVYPLDLANGQPTTDSALSLINGAVPESSQPVADFSNPDGLPPGQVYTSSDEFVIKRSQKQQRHWRGING